MDCVFCKIASGELPSEPVAQGPEWIAIQDIRPQAPTHVLVVPRSHVGSLDELEDSALAGTLLLAAGQVARAAGLDAGWRLIVNTGRDGGQEVEHLHLHVMGGRPLGRMLAGV